MVSQKPPGAKILKYLQTTPKKKQVRIGGFCGWFRKRNRARNFQKPGEIFSKTRQEKIFFSPNRFVSLPRNPMAICVIYF
jgi:hypothetical protein